MLYSAVFWVALLLNAVVTVRSSSLYQRYFVSSSSSSSATEKEENVLEKQRHKSLLTRYLIVYLLATLSDWLQGPYVYALYDSYGYSQHDIAVLFVAGFGSSMVFGSFVGGMADWGGRRRFVVLFCVIYAASCITKHFKNFHILMLGRLLGGVATSLLFSVFEAWLIRAHADANIDKSFLSTSFSSAAYGNSIIAILAGLIANKAASASNMVPLINGGNTTTQDAAVMDGHEEALLFIGGFLSPFDIALLALCVCGTCAVLLWDENYGDTSASLRNNDAASDDGAAHPSWHDGLKNALDTTMRNRDVLLCGLVSSLFEGSMYVFVFMWTPALTALSESKDELPFGLIFSTFMVCCMAGSSIFSILIKHLRPEALAVIVFLISSLAMAMVSMATSNLISFLGMNLFEVCVGMYFPIMGTLKGTIVPEDKRAAIYNLYRIPLNFIVLLALLTDLTPTQSFACNTAMLVTATVLAVNLMKRRRLYSQQESFVSNKEEQQEEETELTKGLVVAAAAEEAV